MCLRLFCVMLAMLLRRFVPSGIILVTWDHDHGHGLQGCRSEVIPGTLSLRAKRCLRPFQMCDYSYFLAGLGETPQAGHRALFQSPNDSNKQENTLQCGMR